MPDYESRWHLGEGMRIGIPKNRVPRGGEIEPCGSRACSGSGCRRANCDIAADDQYALPTYYIVAPAGLVNLARYDGVRYGLRVAAATSSACTAHAPRRFYKEVRRRRPIGNMLSAGYYDAYYLHAQRCTLIKRDFENCFAGTSAPS